MKHTLTATVYLILAAAPAFAAAGGWRGIVPLHSTRADVERLLGPPARVFMDIYIYEFEKDTVKFDFSEGPCGVASSIWDVPLHTVTGITVTPKPGLLKFTDLKLDVSKFRKEEARDVGGVFNYVNEGEGVTYQIDMSYDDAVTLVSYYPAAKDAGLRCPPKRTTAPARAQAKSNAKRNSRRRGKP